MDGTATVHLVDDDPAFLAALSRLLRAAGFTVTTCESGADLLSRVSAQTRGCVVADLEMPGIGGLELQAMLAQRAVSIPVIFLTGHGNIPCSVRAMRGGAVDFLEKIASKDQLLAAIGYALERDAEMHARQARLLERRRRLESLTEREREVMALVVRGKMNKQIAAALGIHERTVKLHRTAISTKLRVHGGAQLAVLASDARLLNADALS